MKKNECPPIPENLLNFLDKAFPEKCPDLDAPDREVWARAGERRVVRFLKRQFALQNEKGQNQQD